MFVANDLALVGDLYLNDGVFVQDNGLATQAAFDAGVDGPVDKVFFLVADLFEGITAAVDVNVASAAGTHFAAIVVQVNAIFFGYLEDADVGWNVFDGLGRNAFVFESEFNGCHCGVVLLKRQCLACDGCTSRENRSLADPDLL